MEKQFIPYKLALKLRELGFDEECFGWWSYINGNNAMYYGYPSNNTKLFELNMFPNNCTAPLWQQAFDWFRINYNYEISIHKILDEPGYMATIGWTDAEGFQSQVEGSTYEEARLACLTELIRILNTLH